MKCHLQNLIQCKLIHYNVKNLSVPDNNSKTPNNHRIAKITMLYNMFVLLLIKKYKVMISAEILNQKLQNIRKEIIKFQNNCNHTQKLFTIENKNKRLICNTCQKILPYC